jgi:hypothetical protein
LLQKVLVQPETLEAVLSQAQDPLPCVRRTLFKEVLCPHSVLMLPADLHPLTHPESLSPEQREYVIRHALYHNRSKSGGSGDDVARVLMWCWYTAVTHGQQPLVALVNLMPTGCGGVAEATMAVLLCQRPLILSREVNCGLCLARTVDPRLHQYGPDSSQLPSLQEAFTLAIAIKHVELIWSSTEFKGARQYVLGLPRQILRLWQDHEATQC